LKSIVDELRTKVPSRQPIGNWFSGLTPAQQAEIEDAVRRKAAGELPHSWRQIGRLIRSRYGLAVGERYLASELVELSRCRKRSPTK